MIKYGKIVSAGRNDLLTEYEFADTHMEKVNNEKLYTVSFFKTAPNNTIEKQQLYAIRKQGPDIYLYNKNAELKFIFQPVKDGQ